MTRHGLSQLLRRREGFSLVEMAILLVIFGGLAAASTMLGSKWVEGTEVQTSRQNIETIEKAIDAYVRLNRRLPCPAPETVASSSSDFGKEADGLGSCTAGADDAESASTNTRKGVVPFKTLGIGKSMAYDAWGNRLSYYVDVRMTEEDAIDQYPLNSTTVGDIVVQDLTSTNRTDKAVFALVSHGARAHGARNRSGSLVTADSPHAGELENADVNAAGASTGLDNVLVQAMVSGNFDDIVSYKLRNGLAAEGGVNSSQNCLGATVNWTQGASNCTGSVAELADGQSVQVIDNSGAGTDEGTVTVVCDAGTLSQLSPVCSLTPGTCPAQAVSWTVGANTCNASTSALLNNGQNEDVTDSSGAATGTARFTCTAGSLVASMTVCNVECAASTENWTQGGNNCSGSVGVLAHGASTTVSDALGLPTDQTSGNVTVTCNNGTRSQSGITCTFTNNDCASGTRNWSVDNGNGTRNCSGNLAALTHGNSGTATDSTAAVPSNGSGTANYSCSNGTLTEGAKTCRSQCAAASATWTVGGSSCAQSHGVLNDGDSLVLTDGVGPDTGGVTVSCSDGVITQSGATCTAPSCTVGSADALRFRASASPSLSRTPASAGNRTTWTMSMWVKPGAILNEANTLRTLFEAIGGVGSTTGSYFYNQKLRFYWNSSNIVEPATVFRDPSTWYHLTFVWDTSNTNANDRIRLFVNGVRVGTFTTNNQPAQNTLSFFNANILNTIGSYTNSLYFFDGYMDKVHFVDGQALEPTSFGEFNSDGVWIPKSYAGAYGTNGFKLEFDNASTTATLGNDSSGNGNHFTTTGFSVANDSTRDSVADHPGTNYAAWNPLDANLVTTSNGNLTADTPAFSNQIRATIGMASGKWYWEVTPTSANGQAVCPGIVSEKGPNTLWLGWDIYGWCYNGNTGQIFNNTTNSAFSVAFGQNDVIGVAFDADTGKLWFAKNGTWGASGNPATGASPARTLPTGEVYFPALGDSSNGSATTSTVNFGQQPFVYTAPSGFKSLSATNLAAPSITKPREHFDVITYTGNGGGGQLGQIARDSSSYQLSRSARFRPSASPSLQRTPASAGSASWTWSGWVKRGTLGSQPLMVAGSPGGVYYISSLTINGNDQIAYTEGTNTNALIARGFGYHASSRTFKDTSRWYHIVVNSSAPGTYQLWVDGVQEAFPLASTAYAGGGYMGYWNYFGKNVQHNVCGGFNQNGLQYCDGYMADVHFIDGQALPASNFGEFDTKGHWQPKAYGGAYGTNGFRLDFADNSSVAQLGNDVSGNNNDFTPAGFSIASDYTNDSLTDVPTSWDDSGNGRGNYATLSATDISTILPSGTAAQDGNLTFVADAFWDGSTQYVGRRATMPSKGKDYWEVTRLDSITKNVNIGLAQDDAVLAGPGNGGTPYDMYVYGNNFQGLGVQGYIAFDGSYSAGLPVSITSGDVIMISHDAANKRIWFGKNGSWFNSGNPATGANPTITYTTDQTLYPVFTSASFAGTSRHAINFGQRPFAYTPPTGFKALNSQNAGVSTKFAGKPDLVWLKSRSGATDHALYDSARGIKKDLASNTTGAETTQEGGVVQFNDDGVLIGDLAKINTAGTKNVGWMWNEDAAAGFDIVKWTGTGGDRTINHNLGRTPQFMIVRNNNQTANWRIYHAGANATPQNGRLFFDTSPFTTESTAWNNTAPTSSQFTVGTDLNVNTYEYVAYLWAEIPGFSKFGKYTGNGSTDGPFVYTGFKPRWVLSKQATGAAAHWYLLDTERDTTNPMLRQFQPNLTNAEGMGHIIYDSNANGFKVRAPGTPSFNNSGDTYIYAAFAEMPFTAAGSSSSSSCGCALPWGGSISSGSSVNAYSVASVTCGSSCPAPVSRTCTNGVLSGSGDYSSCSVAACANCAAGTANWTVGAYSCTASVGALNHGNNSTVADTTPTNVGGATVTCNNGAYNYSATSCAEATTCGSFTTPNVCSGTAMASGQAFASVPLCAAYCGNNGGTCCQYISFFGQPTSCTPYNGSKIVGGGVNNYAADCALPDTTPNAFSFTDQTGVALNTPIDSNIIQITGINTASAVSVSGGTTPQYRICSDATCSSVVVNWTNGANNITNNQYLQVRQTSSTSASDTTSITVNVGTGSDTWSVTTGNN